MRTGVDVWLIGEQVGNLTPSPVSITDGSSPATVVHTCCRHKPGTRGLAIDLAVDQATADRFSRSCRLEALWARRVAPALYAAAVLILVVGGVALATKNSDLLRIGVPLSVAFVIAVAIARVTLLALRSRQHPRLLENGDVRIRDVDPDAARAWAELNPGAIMIGNFRS